jgi:hypothetical protein
MSPAKGAMSATIESGAAARSADDPPYEPAKRSTIEIYGILRRKAAGQHEETTVITGLRSFGASMGPVAIFCSSAAETRYQPHGKCCHFKILSLP